MGNTRYGIAMASTILMSASGLVSVSAMAQEVEGALEQSSADGEEEAQETSAGIGDIIVTATRRAESLQDVPVAVTAVTTDTLGAADVSTIRTLTQVVPGFIGSRNMGVFQPVVRGVGSTGISIGDEPNIATYIDGVYQPESAANWIDLVEVERVEVLRGPQGITFGRNATGGLINVITPDPSFSFRGKGAFRIGRMRNDANDYDARIYLTGPVTDTVAADFAGLYRKTEGYIEDLVRGGGLGDQQVIDVRSKLMYEPSSRFKVVVTGEYFDQDSTTNSPQPIDGNTAGRRFPGVILPTEPWQASLTDVPDLNLKRWNVALHTSLDLGSVVLDTTGGWMNLRWFQNTDSDATNIKLGNFPAEFNAESGSQEIKLSSNNSSPFQWLLGGYFYQFGGNADIAPFTTPDPDQPLRGPVLEPDLSGRSFAGFAEGIYEIQQGLFITLGGRYTTETRNYTQRLFGNVVVDDAEETFDNIDYKVGVRYELTPRTSVYANYGTAFKSGVFNMAALSDEAVEPETIDAAEFGIKSDPLPWLRANLAIYHYDYKGLQLQSKDDVGSSYVLQNAANAKIYGGEFEAFVVPTDDLNLRAAVAYTHARYEDFTDAQGFFPRDDGGNFVEAFDASGNTMTRAPEWSGSFGAQWGSDVGGGRMTVAGNLSWSSRVYYDFANIFSQPSYALISGSVTWSPDDERFKIGLWGTNLTNESVLQTIRPGALGTDGFYEQPRKVGLSVETRF